MQAPVSTTPHRPAPSPAPSHAPQSRDSTHSTSSYRSEPWEGSAARDASSLRCSSSSSLRRLDGAASSCAAEGDVYDIFEPRGAPEQDGAGSLSQDCRDVWHSQDLEAVKCMTGALTTVSAQHQSSQACFSMTHPASFTAVFQEAGSAWAVSLYADTSSQVFCCGG